MQSNERVKLPVMWLTIAVVLTFVRAFTQLGAILFGIASIYSWLMIENKYNPGLWLVSGACFLIYLGATKLFFKLPID